MRKQKFVVVTTKDGLIEVLTLEEFCEDFNEMSEEKIAIVEAMKREGVIMTKEGKKIKKQADKLFEMSENGQCFDENCS